jgi:hypothetical protein
MSRGTGVVIRRCAQRAVGLDRLPQPRGIVIAAPRLPLGWIGLAVEVLCLLGYLDLRVLRTSVSRAAVLQDEKITYPLAAEWTNSSEIAQPVEVIL